ncbi:MAG TPA: hypothetical protein VMB03_04130 [Bryobacteraceae bacterium]|nr:hypothetical protein [Bryobacteraceae bacterium]
MRTVGIVLIVLGMVGLAWGAFTQPRDRKVLEIGPTHASRNQARIIPIPLIAGTSALVGGVLLVLIWPR